MCYLSVRTTEDFLVGPPGIPTCVQTLKIPVRHRENCTVVHIVYHGYFTPAHSTEFVVLRGKQDLLLKAAEQEQSLAVPGQVSATCTSHCQD